MGAPVRSATRKIGPMSAGCVRAAQASSAGSFSASAISARAYPGCADITGVGGPACAGSHPVAQKRPNAWGLYDMSGNMWEWCHDRWKSNIGTAALTDPVVDGAGTDCDLRGGSWFLDADLLRGAYRKHLPDTTVDYNFGVRCVRTK